MSRNVEERVIALTVSLVLLAVVVAVVGYYGWQKVGELEGQVAQLETQLSTADERLDAVEAAVIATVEVAVAARSDVQAMQGFGFGFLSRSLSDLDDDLGTVEGCLRSIVDIVDGFGQSLDFSCNRL